MFYLFAYITTRNQVTCINAACMTTWRTTRSSWRTSKVPSGECKATIRGEALVAGTGLVRTNSIMETAR